MANLVKAYIKDVMKDADDSRSTESRECKYCQHEDKALQKATKIDYCYHCHFYKATIKNKNFKLKDEIVQILTALTE